MSGEIKYNRRRFLGAAAMTFAAAKFGIFSSAQAQSREAGLVEVSVASTDGIRPFRINVPEGALVDLRQRIGGTRWPDRETVDDRSQGVTRDEMLDDITLYWLTNTGTSSARVYWENNNNNFNAVDQKTADISIPVAVTVFPGEIYRAPKSWAERAYHNLIYFNEVNNGGHFAAWEQPQLFSEEMRAAFRSLRRS
jgi:pimeloyl-ACP methyl ester carboxylesterase